MKKMTEQNVKDALAGESQAHIKYLAFADQAAKEKLPNIARSFKANSFAEQIHATNHFRTLGGIGKTLARNRPQPMCSSSAGSLIRRTMSS